MRHGVHTRTFLPLRRNLALCALGVVALTLPGTSLTSTGAPRATTATVSFSVNIHQEFGLGTAVNDIRGRGFLNGPGDTGHAGHLKPKHGTGPNHGAPGFRYLSRRGHDYVLDIVTGSYTRGPHTDRLAFTVAVRESSNPNCKDGSRGRVVILRNRIGGIDSVEVDLVCGHSVEWRDSDLSITVHVSEKGSPNKPPVSGAWPGGTATKLTLTIGGVTATTNLKTGAQTPPDPILKAKSTTTLSGSVSVNGTLPKGWTIAVFHLTGTDILLNSPKGGAFAGVKPFAPTFDAFTRPGAYICSTKVPPLCAPAAQANISIDWDP